MTHRPNMYGCLIISQYHWFTNQKPQLGYYSQCGRFPTKIFSLPFMLFGVIGWNIRNYFLIFIQSRLIEQADYG